MQYGITNPNDSEGLEDLISTGCQLVILITGRGSVIGSAVAPTLKITGNDKTFHALEEDMDFNAGRVLAGTISMERMTEELVKAIIASVNGTQTKSERLGHKEYCIPYKYQNPTRLTCGKT